jgi:transposase
LLHLTTKTDTTQWRWEFARDRSHEQIGELKRQGLKQADIAKKLKVSKGQVSKVFSKLEGTAGGAEAGRGEED